MSPRQRVWFTLGCLFVAAAQLPTSLHLVLEDVGGAYGRFGVERTPLAQRADDVREEAGRLAPLANVDVARAGVR